jgi:hypothetical protein
MFCHSFVVFCCEICRFTAGGRAKLQRQQKGKKKHCRISQQNPVNLLPNNFTLGFIPSEMREIKSRTHLLFVFCLFVWLVALQTK